jgi:STE24 endopeptidase
MSRLLILILFMLWLCDPTQGSAVPAFRLALPLFFGVYVVLVFATGFWGRYIARRVAAWNFQQSLKRFNLMMEAARMAIPVWFVIGLYFLGWRAAVANLLGPSLMNSVLGVIIGTLPPFAAWMGLWWSQYPADRALREQSLLTLIDADLPLHAPPRFASYFLSNLRLQILFLGVPLLLIVLGHDLGMLLGSALHLQEEAMNVLEIVSWIVSAGGVFLFAPEILRRVLHTEPLGDSPLRRRLHALCQRTGIRYRDVLLWKTDHNMGNAAVMGFVPRLRYILLSDLLLEQMPDDEIEAVFAHEMGHIVHRHMNWYVVFVVVLAMINAGPGSRLGDAFAKWLGGTAQDLVPAVLTIGTFLLLFGYISRKFERQADVYAARTIQMRHPLELPAGVSLLPAVDALGDDENGDALLENPSVAIPQLPATPRAKLPSSFVGPYGAALFASALRRVAIVNNIPIAARSWCHGSIATRMQYLQGLSLDPQLTAGFDRYMRWIYTALIGALVVSATILAIS